MRDGIYEIMRRRRSCEASLTLCSVPVGFGSGGQLNMWSPHTQHLQPLQEGTHGGPARAHCGRRLNGNVCQTMLGTADPTSRAGQQLDRCIQGATSISACSAGCHCWGLQPARVKRSHPWKCPSWQCCPYSRIRVGCAHSRAASCQLAAAMVSCMWHSYASVLQACLTTEGRRAVVRGRRACRDPWTLSQMRPPYGSGVEFNMWCVHDFV